MVMQREELHEAIKEALKEWLDEKFIFVGKWTAGGFISALLVAGVYLIFITNGWKLQ